MTTIHLIQIIAKTLNLMMFYFRPYNQADLALLRLVIQGDLSYRAVTYRPQVIIHLVITCITPAMPRRDEYPTISSNSNLSNNSQCHLRELWRCPSHYSSSNSRDLHRGRSRTRPTITLSSWVRVVQKRVPTLGLRVTGEKACTTITRYLYDKSPSDIPLNLIKRTKQWRVKTEKYSFFAEKDNEDIEIFVVDCVTVIFVKQQQQERLAGMKPDLKCFLLRFWFWSAMIPTPVVYFACVNVCERKRWMNSCQSACRLRYVTYGQLVVFYLIFPLLSKLQGTKSFISRESLHLLEARTRLHRPIQKIHAHSLPS